MFLYGVATGFSPLDHFRGRSEYLTFGECPPFLESIDRYMQLTAILTCRFLLNLRSASDDTATLMTQVSTVRFATPKGVDIVGNMGASLDHTTRVPYTELD